LLLPVLLLLLLLLLLPPLPLCLSPSPHWPGACLCPPPRLKGKRGGERTGTACADKSLSPRPSPLS
jgi:hypothetical protein